MMKRYKLSGVAAVVAFGLSASVNATLIDFEGGLPAVDTGDGALVQATDYNSLGISIVAGSGVQLAYEAVGAHAENAGLPDGSTSPDPEEGFVRDYTTSGPKVYDRERAGYEGQLGEMFMRSVPGADPNAGQNFLANPFFSILYLDGFTVEGSVRGQIWDIDGNQYGGSEGWMVTALDGVGTVLGSISSGNYDSNGESSLDALPWDFEFTGVDLGEGAYSVSRIRQLDFNFTGSKTEGVGVAFDNFHSGVNVPDGGATLALMGVALFGLSGLGRRIKK